MVVSFDSEQIRRPWGAVLSMAGIFMFCVVILFLHIMQKNYDPIHQLMSEFVFGLYGWMMIFAFTGLACAVLGIVIELMHCVAGFGLRLLLGLASVCFMIAGIFSLRDEIVIHIASIATAFILTTLSIYLYPSYAGQASRLAPRRLSWSLAACVAMSVGLGHQLIPSGVSQRLAALFLLMWLVMVSWRLWWRVEREYR